MKEYRSTNSATFRIPRTPYQSGLPQIRYYAPGISRNQRRRWWTLVKNQTWIGWCPSKYQAYLLGHFNLWKGRLASRK